MSTGWLFVLFGLMVAWGCFEIYSWWKHDPRFPTISDLLVKYFTPRGLALCTILLCVALLLHWETIRQQALILLSLKEFTMDATAIALAIASILVVVLSYVFKGMGVGNPEKLWIEFILAVVLAPVALAATGVLPPFPGNLPAGDPMAFFGALVAYAKILWTYVAGVAALAIVIYNYFEEKIKKGIRARLATK